MSVPNELSHSPTVYAPQRWVVERTFGWFNWSRRLSKDYEILTDTSEARRIAFMTDRIFDTAAIRSIPTIIDRDAQELNDEEH